MIFVGDIAIPSHIELNTEEIEEVFSGCPVVANLEGPILPGEQEEEYLSKKVLFSGSDHLATFKKMGIKLFNLANNHSMDIPSGWDSTRKFLDNNEIAYVGAGSNRKMAARPVILHQNGKEYAFLAFGWKTIQCQPPKKGREGVNPLFPEHILNSVHKCKLNHPDAVIVILMHWNYELEEYPQPFDRQLAHRCIDNGAGAVIGCHSHCVQGIEMYKEAPIVYSLGNWFIPHRTFFSGRLRFPEKSYLQLAFDWEPGKEPTCHWFLYQPDSQEITYLESELLSNSAIVTQKTPFENLNHAQYIEWFKKHRIKKMALPVFKNVNDEIPNKIKHYWVKARDLVINLMLTLRLKKIRRDT